ncbi:uncharacterized protein RCC_04343 [Ramularia collo-cygni]|uniref:RING-type domain-containing protein n=1 Tax=Ramularia collo-cygni TaxID=112498 RepID=A0A2D3UTW5_9PEZI|nr:uncharacterized protein RCC_04343 [Ramularia collo-cygni]CZT18498.1 uncharacterized protein RCC_04343 [Ramularia collo-cygni]
MHYVKQPLLALGLAIAYTVFTCIPGSWSASNLPKYSKFRQRLVIVEANDKDCMVCYDKENPLALLPCNHECCTGCLDLMAAGYQTTCPACRTPLFNANDEIIYALTRGSVASMVTNIILLSFVGFQDYRDSDWTGVAIRFGSQCVLTPMLWFYGTLMWEHGDGWWRMIFSAAKRTPLDLKMAVFAMASGTFASWAILWSTRGYFT